MKKIIIIAIALITFALLPANWNESYDSGIKTAVRDESPVLFYFYADGDERSDEFGQIIDGGLLDFMSRQFVMTKVDLSKEENLKFAQTIGVQSIPLFLLEDFHPARKKVIQPVFIEPMDILRNISDIYMRTGDYFKKAGDTGNAYYAYKLIEDMPDELGEKAKKSIKEIEPKTEKKTTLKQTSENKAKAESYYKTAMDNLKNKRYEKAYLYFEKVIELAPDTEIAKNSASEKEKIKDKVDKSVLIK
jgi:tetratricopeptide (TPR) repeat protein